jgi:hypothetical protein
VYVIFEGFVSLELPVVANWFRLLKYVVVEDCCVFEVIKRKKLRELPEKTSNCGVPTRTGVFKLKLSLIKFVPDVDSVLLIDGARSEFSKLPNVFRYNLLL